MHVKWFRNLHNVRERKREKKSHTHTYKAIFISSFGMHSCTLSVSINKTENSLLFCATAAAAVAPLKHSHLSTPSFKNSFSTKISASFEMQSENEFQLKVTKWLFAKMKYLWILVCERLCWIKNVKLLWDGILCTFQRKEMERKSEREREKRAN